MRAPGVLFLLLGLGVACNGPPASKDPGHPKPKDIQVSTTFEGSEVHEGDIVEVAPIPVGVQHSYSFSRRASGEDTVTAVDAEDAVGADVVADAELYTLPATLGDPMSSVGDQLDFLAVVTPSAPEWSVDLVISGDHPIRFTVVAADEGLPGTTDADGDGYPAATDCDDADPAVNPGAPEVCNHLDDNCNGEVDEGLPVVRRYADADEDGYGDPWTYEDGCDDGDPGLTTDGTDCDDTDASVHPGAPDRVDDAVDSDCDGLRCEKDTLDGAAFGLCFGEFDWASARELCQDSFGGDMASVRSAAEQQFVREIMIRADMPYSLLGLSDVASEGVFLWVDGASLAYTNWGTGEPNNGGGGTGGEAWAAATGENCAAIQGDRDYTWNDIPCDLVTNSAVLCGRR